MYVPQKGFTKLSITMPSYHLLLGSFACNFLVMMDGKTCFSKLLLYEKYQIMSKLYQHTMNLSLSEQV